MERFRDFLGVGAGARADNFMHNVVTPALLEGNGLSDISVQIEMARGAQSGGKAVVYSQTALESSRNQLLPGIWPKGHIA